MTLLELKLELTRTNDILERMAGALERIAGPLLEDEPYVPRQTQPQDIGRTAGGERAALARLRTLSKELGEK